MQWQFGGNLEPVQMICEIDWKECPKAIGNYIWSEIVTDVLDCLRNEGTVWRVFAVFCICTILLRVIYSKSRQTNDTAVNKDILDKVGYKVEDLELKVSILTYKMQYGSWPFPHQIHKPSFRKNLKNVRLTLSNPSDRNEWIKNILLSPKTSKSYIPCSRYDYPSKHRLTELFDAKKSVYPYLRQNIFSVERSSKSSRSSSDKSLKFNYVHRKKINRQQRKMSKSENLEMQHRDATLFPLFIRKKNSKSASKMNKNSILFDANNVNGSCIKFTKSMDDCKRYLRELHKSNKNLGIINNSSGISDESLAQNLLPKVQQQGCIQRKEKSGRITKEGNEEKEMNLNGTSSKQLNKMNCLEVSNVMHPVLKLIDKNVMPGAMNITFHTEMFPQPPVTDLLIPQSSCERQKVLRTSQESLNQVKKKLESLHNVIRTYEIENSEGKLTENDNKRNNVCQNIVNALISVTSGVNNWNEGKRSRISSDNNTKNFIETEETLCNSSDQYESDETGKSSEISARNYLSTYNIYSANNIHNGHYNEAMYSGIKYDKIPERVYYSISSESFEGKDIKQVTAITENITTLPNACIDSNQMKLIVFPELCPVPMETDEDMIVLSPISSRTEMSKDSEYDEESTALLLQEAIQFKKALLTRVEHEKICYVENSKENVDGFTSKLGSCSYINNNFQTKFLDIISEEQSASSSTEKTSRTYMCFNIKQDKQMVYSSTLNNDVTAYTRNEMKDQNLCKEYFDSNYNLDSPSEYFSFSNIIEKGNVVSGSQLCLSKHSFLQPNESNELIPLNLQLQYFNNNLDKSDEKIVGVQLANRLYNLETKRNEHDVYYNYIHETDNFRNQLLRIDDINEVTNNDSVELFSEILNEGLLDEQNPNGNETSKYFNHESGQRCADMSCGEDTEDNLLDRKQNVSSDDKYNESNDMLMYRPNFSLKRHPGACSLLERTNAERGIHEMIENINGIYELSATESKDHSIETNLMQDSLTSSINNSNDSNIPEPPSVMVLINKSMDEEDSNLNWSDLKNNHSSDYVNAQCMQSLSKNTMILKGRDITEIQNYCKLELACDEGITSTAPCTATEIHKDQYDQVKSEKNNLIASSFVRFIKRDSTNEADFRKSYSNLISPHSSLYFTDEASSSMVRINNICPKDAENDLQSNLCVQTENKELLQNKNAVLKNTGNNELTFTSVLNEKTSVTNTETSCAGVVDDRYDKRAKLSDRNSDLNNKNNESSAKNDLKSIDISNNETKQTSDIKRKITNNNVSTSCTTNELPKNINVITNKARSYYLINEKETLNVRQSEFLSNSSLRQISPRDIKESVMTKKANKTAKSKSQDNYISRVESRKKSISPQNIKSLNSNLSSATNIEERAEHNVRSPRKRGRDLSAESVRNTERNTHVVKKRSRSEISFRTNESPKEITSKSYEFPKNSSGIDISDNIYYHNCDNSLSLETKLKLENQKSFLPTSKISSKSCIPILKSRLEAAKRTENETRPKSPMRGPLTMTMSWRDNMCSKTAQEVQVEGKSENNSQYIEKNDSCLTKIDNNRSPTGKEESMKKLQILKALTEHPTNIKPQEQMVIYVNIFTKYDHDITKIVNPNKLLEYIKSRKSNVQTMSEGKESKENKDVPYNLVDKKSNEMQKIITIVSSIISGNELNDQTTSNDSSTPKPNTESLASTITSDTLRNLCFLSVEQREVDVTAKPSVIDTSTSISDLENTIDISKNTLNKFQVCGTPKELNNEEYLALLEILHQEPNFVHLKELENVCKKLIPEH